MSANFERIEAVFSQAVEFDPEERAAFLAGACGEDAELRAKVQAMLQAHEGAEGFLPAEPRNQAPAGPLAEKPGSRIGHYKLLQQIGEGGCGVVYMAEQERPVRRRVALKIIKLGMDTKAVVARFEAERQALALMDHPNIARIYDAGVTGPPLSSPGQGSPFSTIHSALSTYYGRPYFVMELVRGVKITDYCDQNRLSTQQRLDLFIQVCRAIQHAHQKGIIHRDIKPSNILVTVNDGVRVPKVIDFGIAKATQGRLTDQTLFTAFEQFIGTPAYMSPEQAAMTSLDIDTRSDIYSLGVLLYELLTGQTPFDTKELLAAGLDGMRRTICEKEPLRPSTRLRQTALATPGSPLAPRPSPLASDLDWIVMKCLEKERTRRYETASGLARDIERNLHHEPVAARPPSRLYEFQKTVRRHWIGFCATTAVVTALALGAAVSAWQALRASRQAGLAEAGRREAQASRREATLAQKRAEAGEQAARQNLYAADMNLAQEAILARNWGRARSLLQAHRPQPGQPDFRGFEWRHLWAVLRGDELAYLGTNDTTVISVAFSPDGKWLAMGNSNGVATVVDLATRRTVASLRPRGDLWAMAFTPAGHNLVISCWMETDLDVWDISHQRLARSLAGHKGHIWNMAFSPDGQTMATVSSDETVRLWDVATWRTREILRGHGREIWSVAFTPDGQYLITGGAFDPVMLWPVRPSRPPETIADVCSDPIFSPDGSLFAHHRRQ